MRSRVAGATSSGRLSARDTVAACTPARAATSSMVTRSARRTAHDATPRRDRPSGCRRDLAERRRSRPTTGRRRRRSSTSGSAPSPGPTSASTPTTSCAPGWPAMIRGVSLRSRRAEEQLGPAGRPVLASIEREPGEDAPAAGPRVAGVGGDRPGGGRRGHRRADHDAGHPHGHREGLRARATGRRPRRRPRASPGGTGAARRRRSSPRSTTSLDNGDAAPPAGARGRRAVDADLARWIADAGAGSRARSSTAWSRRRRRPTSTTSSAASASGTRPRSWPSTTARG